MFVVFALALTITDETSAIANENEDTTMIDSIQSRHVGHTVGVQENHSEFTRVVNLTRLVFEVAFRTSALVHVFKIVMNLSLVIFTLGFGVDIYLVLLARFPIVLHVLATTELFKHDHLITPVFWRLCKKGLFLLILSCINDICPFLLILSFEVAKEFVKRLIALSHRPNASV